MQLSKMNEAFCVQQYIRFKRSCALDKIGFGGITMIKRAEEKDIAAIANLAAMMWSNHSAEELNNEFSEHRQRILRYHLQKI